ncbi:MAG TPA: ABC transporter ATP-binding protein [Chitinispirillaceae bacterium]|nr:ABC transporter ATP-binding protein [Chitinispirillaceae bacterium]
MNINEEPPVIHALNVCKSFGKHTVIEDVSLSVEAGIVYGLVGLNGAGKTTLLRLLLELLSPDKGSTEVLAGTMFRKREQMYQHCGVVLDHDGFWGNMTIMENLKFYADAKGLSRESLTNYLEEDWAETGLLKINKKVKHLSRGQKMQCALCRAFMGKPEALFLDEPVIALDLHAYRHFCTLIKKAKEKNAAVIISSHQLELIDELCDRVAILKDKKLEEVECHRTPVWTIVTDKRDQWRHILEQCGAANIQYFDGWNFALENREMIPEIVTRLSSAGCKMYGIFQAGNEFSSAIRSIFGPVES